MIQALGFRLQASGFRAEPSLYVKCKVEQRGHNSNGFKAFCLKAEARMWPWLSCVCRVAMPLSGAQVSKPSPSAASSARSSEERTPSKVSSSYTSILSDI
jgi:hypothetical protein